MINDKKLSVLYIEDNLDDVCMIQDMLSMDSNAIIEVEGAQLLEEGLEMLKAKPYDLLLLDLALPDSFGIDTLLKVKAAGVDIPIIVVTGNENAQNGALLLELGAQDYLTKGLSSFGLLIKIIQHATIADEATKGKPWNKGNAVKE